MDWETWCRNKSSCHLRYSVAIRLLWLRITMKSLNSLCTWWKPNCKPLLHTPPFLFLNVRRALVCLERFRNENNLVYGFCYTYYKTVTTLYALPFTHEKPNALSHIYTTGLSAKQLYKNSDSWFVCHKQHLPYKQTVHKIHTHWQILYCLFNMIIDI
jgi:hypothetical protein